MQFAAIFATNGPRQAARLGIPLRTKPLHPTTSVVSTISRMAARFIGRAIPGLISFMATYIKGGFLKGAKEELWDTLSQTKPLHLTTFVASTISVMAPQIYWTLTHGSHLIYGEIYQQWMSLGGETGYLGYPVTDESPTGTRGGRYNDFLNGSIYSSAATGQAHDHRGPLPDSVDFQQNHTFPEGVALGGWSHVTLHSNGGVTSSGHMHDSGAPDYSYSILWVLIDADNSGYTLIHDGECHGDAPGSRDSDWNEVHTQAAPVVAAN
jgi:LGFP repeat